MSPNPRQTRVERYGWRSFRIGFFSYDLLSRPSLSEKDAGEGLLPLLERLLDVLELLLCGIEEGLQLMVALAALPQLLVELLIKGDLGQLFNLRGSLPTHATFSARRAAKTAATN